MKINSELIKKERKVRAWSQQYLAEVAELSLRTVQRIENNGNASTESTKAIAAAFDLEPHHLLLIIQKKSLFGISRTIAVTVLATLTPIFYLSFINRLLDGFGAQDDHLKFV